MAQHPGYAPAFLKELHYEPELRLRGDLELRLYRHLPEVLQTPVIWAAQGLYYRGGQAGYRKLFPLATEMEKRKRQFGSAFTADFTLRALYSWQTIDGFPHNVSTDKTRFIAILRNPVDFLFSVYTYQINNRLRDINRDVSFDRYVHSPEDCYLNQTFVRGAHATMESWRAQFEQRPFFDERQFSITTFMVCYSVFIKHWASKVVPGRFLVLSFTDLCDRPHDTMKQVFEFLEVPSVDIPDTRAVNANRYSGGSIAPETAAYIREVCKPYNDELYEFLGRDLGWT
jgi:hypothetical protein